MTMPTISTQRTTLDLQPLFAPRSIAIVGASSNATGYSSRTLTNLLETGYTGEIYPVNPRHSKLHGLRSYARVSDIGKPVDAAILLVRSDLVADAVADCVEAGVKMITVCSAGFGEDGPDGMARQQELVDLARRGGSRLIGPNCIGAASVNDHVVPTPTLNITTSYIPGSISIVSQSGGMAVNLFNRAQGRGIGVRGFVSVGNEGDIDMADLVSALADDEETRVIGLFVEELRDVPAFQAAVAKAHRVGKPVLALKVGRSAAGQRSSLSHTGALAGSYSVFQNVMQQLGVLEVDSVDALIDTAGLIAEAKSAHSNRILIVSPSGGECSYAADRATELGLEVLPLPEATAEVLNRRMRFGTATNPFDLTGQVIGDADFLQEVLAELETLPDFDMILYAIPTWGSHDAERLLPGFITAAERSNKPTVISAWSAKNLTEVGEEKLASTSAPTFGSVDAALTALSNLAKWHAIHPDDVSKLTDRVAETSIVRPPGLSLQPTEHEAKLFLAQHGMPVVKEIFVTDPAEAQEAAEKIGWPIVAKQICTDVMHKSDLGLVQVGIQNAAELEQALAEFSAVVRQHGLEPEGILLAEFRKGAEVIIGGVRDPKFGPLVMVGAGGVLAELLDDVVFRQAPISTHEAEQALDHLAIDKMLRGYRGTVFDRDALTELIANFSELFAASDWLSQIDLNPVIVSDKPGSGAVIVDAAFILEPTTKE